MGENINKFGDNTSNYGNISAGDRNTNTVNIDQNKKQEFEELTKELINQIYALNLNDNEKNHLISNIELVKDQVKQDQPDKSKIDFLLKAMDSTLKAIDLIIKPTTLAPAIDKWISLIHNMIGS